MAKAQQLDQRSRAPAGMRVKVNSDTTDVHKAVGEYFVGLLNKLGYKATPQFLSADIQYPYVQNSKNKVQIGWSDWFADYPAASDFLEILLGCDSFHPNSNSSPNIAQFCDKTVAGADGQGRRTGIEDPNAANELWAGVDEATTDKAPWVSIVNPKVLDFTSDRVKGLPVQPAVVLPAGPGVGEVRRGRGGRWPSSPTSRTASIGLAPRRSLREFAGKSPWRLAGRRLVHNRIAMAALAAFVLIVAVSFAAPLYAKHIAHTDPFANNLNGTTVIDGKTRGGDPAERRPAEARRDADRPDVARELLPRRRQPGPRRDGPRAVRRPRVAADRDRVGRAGVRRRAARSRSWRATSAGRSTCSCRASWT